MVLASLTAACGSATEHNAADERQFAALLPFTGDLAAGATNYERAMIFAQEAVNEGGGVASGKLRIREQDTHSDVTRGLSAARQVIDDESILSLVGPADPDLISAMAPLVEGGGIVQILPGITVPSIAVVDVNYWFKIMPSAEVTGCAWAQRLYDDGRRRIVILYEGDEFSRNLADGVAKALGLLQYTGQVFAITFDPAASDSYGQVLSSVYEQAPDAVVLIASAKAGASLVNDWGGPSVVPFKWYFGPSLNTSEFVDNTLPGELEGMIGISPAIPEATSDAFAAEYSKRWAGEYPLISAYAYYDAVAILALAWESAAFASGGPPARQEIRDHIERVSRPPGVVVKWNEIGRGLALLRDGIEVNYQGASSQVDLASSGAIDTDIALFRFWAIRDNQIVPTEYGSCTGLGH
jgi:ABC-type branched-subunit amino acid transport system substrate-binding protein